MVAKTDILFVLHLDCMADASGQTPFKVLCFLGHKLHMQLTAGVVQSIMHAGAAGLSGGTVWSMRKAA